ncbi:MAG: hypothetical protein WCX23_01620 [Candidatus Paceibacterota bacterium]|nr:hypothetical protein [Candidatus Paceibacterota bacterium]MDD4830592.1 hypothetical protein [Candidatus Paceibacterota bacterium]MDD4874967.1 hypothetical protein [Candidatus Paceibacterota bacterium]
MDIENILRIAAACFAAYALLTWLFYEASKRLCSCFKWLDKLFQAFRKVETIQAAFIVAFGFVFFSFYWISDINAGQRSEISDVMKERKDMAQKLEIASKKILALEDEKRLAFYIPQQHEVVQVQPKEQEIQAEETEDVFALGEEKKEEDQEYLSLAKEQLDALALEINQLAAKVRTQNSYSANAGIVKAVKSERLLQ